MPTVTFIGLGLNDERGMTLAGLEEARRADKIFAEFYTNAMPGLDMQRLERLVGKTIEVLSRTQLEDEGGSRILEAGKKGSVAFLVPGDPMIATTHISLRLALAKIGVPSRVINGTSIMCAVCGATGLQSYKFGKSVTLPIQQAVPKSVLDTISDNYARGLHTLLLLDLDQESERRLTISDAVDKIVYADPALAGRLAVGVARLGSKTQQLKATKLSSLRNEDLGSIPHSIVLVGKLHFMEVEALKAFCGGVDIELSEIS